MYHGRGKLKHNILAMIGFRWLSVWSVDEWVAGQKDGLLRRWMEGGLVGRYVAGWMV
jgi:hypothetical protein